AWSHGGIIVGYAGILALLIGWVLVMPLAVDRSAQWMRRLAGRYFGPISRMAAGGVSANLSRTSVAVAALMVAVAASTGVGIMVGSFRTTVGTWLEQVLQADVYIQPPSGGGRLGEAGILPAAEALLRNTEGVASAYAIRRTEVLTTLGRVELAAVETGPHSRRSTQLVDGDAVAAIDRLEAGSHVLVSEPLAWRRGLAPGDSIGFETPLGRRMMAVAGVYYDYASDQGVVMMDRSVYREMYGDDAISGLAVFASRDTTPAGLIERLRESGSGVQNLVIRSNAELRAYSLDVFDRTFTVTAVLRLLTVVVAFVGILSALLALQLERRSEFAVLRANGMTRSQLGRMIRLQCALMGMQAGLLAVPLGLALAWTLIHVINLRSFGWTLQFEAGPALLLQGVAVAVLAALAAGWLPARWIARIEPTEAVRAT
ncbi:MAG: ABC transporter permease, partial [Rhodothermales bacterium]|nr:ABC transporter permease [Rhodothermales bacterium]